jgi:hypothetical protein
MHAAGWFVAVEMDGWRITHPSPDRSRTAPQKQTAAASLPSPSVRTCPIGISRAMAPPKTVVSTLTGLELLSTTVQLALSVQIGPRRCVHASTHHIRVSTDHPLRYRASLTRARVGEQSIVHDPMLHSKFRMRSISHKKIHDSLSLSLLNWLVCLGRRNTKQRGRKQE